MMYSNFLSVTVSVGGKILREIDNSVAIPFGSEYSIRIKNLNSLRALVKVSVDGTDATEDVQLIVPANDTIELERFIKGGNRTRGNRFKFIERTAQIEAHKGIGSDDGLIRVEYWFEKLPPKVEKIVVERRVNEYYERHHPYWWPYTQWPYTPSVTLNRLGDVPVGNQWPVIDGSVGTTFTGRSCFNSFDSMDSCDSGTLGDSSSPQSFNTSSFTKSSPARSAFHASSGLGSAPITPMSCFTMSEASARPEPVNDAGITVAGSESRQQFRHGTWFATETESHVIVLRLRGKVGEKPVVQAVTTHFKPTCSTCGTANKPTAKFCGECGTAVELFG